LSGVADIRGGIGSQDNHIRQLAGLDGANFIFRSERDGSYSHVLAGGGGERVDHHLELAAPRPRVFGFFA
jgi:hypothetical protein